MNAFKKPRWLIKESNVTDENLYFNRREFIRKSSIYLGSSAIAYNFLCKDGTASQNNINDLKFVKNNKYNMISEITSENLSTKYNIFLNLDQQKTFGKNPKN